MFVIHPPRGCSSRIKATFPKAASTEGAAATRSHSVVFLGTVIINHVCVHTTCVRLKAEYERQPGGRHERRTFVLSLNVEIFHVHAFKTH